MSGVGVGDDGQVTRDASVGDGDCLACRLVGAGACFGAAAWVASPLPPGVGAPRPVRLAAAAVAVGLGLARLSL